MSISITIERDEDQILAIYIQISDSDVARTVNVADGACYVDEDAGGNVVGVELLNPATAGANLATVRKRYADKSDIDQLLAKALETVKV